MIGCIQPGYDGGMDNFDLGAVLVDKEETSVRGYQGGSREPFWGRVSPATVVLNSGEGQYLILLTTCVLTV